MEGNCVPPATLLITNTTTGGFRQQLELWLLPLLHKFANHELPFVCVLFLREHIVVWFFEPQQILFDRLADRRDGLLMVYLTGWLDFHHPLLLLYFNSSTVHFFRAGE